MRLTLRCSRLGIDAFINRVGFTLKRVDTSRLNAVVRLPRMRISTSPRLIRKEEENWIVIVLLKNHYNKRIYEKINIPILAITQKTVIQWWPFFTINQFWLINENKYNHSFNNKLIYNKNKAQSGFEWSQNNKKDD